MTKKQMPDVVQDERKWKQGWTGGGAETPCGYGSKMKATKVQRSVLEELIRYRSIRSIVDIGAGDLNWIQHTDLQGAEYVALDIYPRKPQVEKFDIRDEVPPKAHLAMCLWVLNHLPEQSAAAALGNILQSGSKFLLMTWEKRLPAFLDMPFIDEWVIRERDDPEKGHCYLRLHAIGQDAFEQELPW